MQGFTDQQGVPLCVRPLKAAQRCQLLNVASMTIAFKGRDPLVPNAGGTGYYRLELPAKDCDALIAVAGRLLGGEALALDDSLYASLLAGHAQPRQMIALAQGLARNPDSHAAEPGIGSLEWFERAGMLDEAGKAGFRRFLRRTCALRLAELAKIR